MAAPVFSLEDGATGSEIEHQPRMNTDLFAFLVINQTVELRFWSGV